ncbi:hypothetical protein [Glycomyces dulcitolivorans]|uniref:hypothetical protein n=1 Tax=Glycomyces dulcitolivorans TaxID=2200759 RepID=UPI0013008EAE|nr:hypothetical protein [Glycomyces dulcitolivorans]
MKAPAPSLLITGPNRVLFGWTLAVAAAAAIVFAVLTAVGVVDMSLQALLVGGPAGAVGGCIVVLAGRHRIGYDPRARSLVSVGRKTYRQVFSQPAFEHVEYSSARNRVYGVRADGRRQRAPYPAWSYDRREWAAMTARMPKAPE